MASELEPPYPPGAGLAAVAAELVHRVRAELPVVSVLGNGNRDSFVLSGSLYGTGRGFSVRALGAAHGDDGPGSAVRGLGEHDGGAVRGRDLAGDGQPEPGRLVTNAVKATPGRDEAAVRLRLSGDSDRVLIEVWDADPRAPVPKDPGELGTPDPREEGGRGLFLVAALSALGLVPHSGPCGQGCLVRARGVIAARRGVGEGAGTTVRSDQ